MRGDVRKVIPATMSPRASHTTWRCQIVATNVGASVWPAEYRVASPYSASKTTDRNRPLSSWRTRDSTFDRNDGRKRVGEHGNLEWRGRGVVGQHHAHLRRRALVNAEVVRNRPGDKRRDRSAVSRELYDRAHNNLWLVCRGEANEPTMIESMRVLRRRRLTCDRDVRQPRAACRPLLHYGNHRAAKNGQLVGVQIQRGIRSGRRPGAHDKRRPHPAVTRELLVEPHHLHERLGVLALSDGQVQSDSRRPAAWAVQAVVILRSGGKLGGNLVGQVDPGAAVKAPLVRVLEKRRHPQLDAKLVEVDVAALRDRFRQG